MLPQSQRLTKDADFKLVYSRGSRINTRVATLRYFEMLKFREAPTTSAIVTRAKEFPRAVDRNKAKRLIAAALREKKNNIPKYGFKLVWHARPEILNTSWVIVVKDIVYLLLQINHFKQAIKPH